MDQLRNRRLPWSRILGEGLVIVASILMAFAIDALWDTRRDRLEEQGIIDDLRGEFEAALATIRPIIARHQEYDALIRRLDVVTASEIGALPADSTAAYFFATHAWPTYDPRTGTLDGVVMSGRLEVFSDGELRSLLAEWRRRISDMQEEANLMTRASEEFLTLFAQLRSIPAAAADVSADLVVTVLSNPQLIGAARRKVYFGNMYQAELARAAALADTIISKLGR